MGLSRILDFGARIVAGLVAGAVNSSLVPVASSLVSLVRKLVGDTGSVEDVYGGVLRLFGEGKITISSLVEVVREVLSRRDVRDAVFRELNIGVDPIAIDQFCFYYSRVDRGFYDEFLKFRDAVLSELRVVRRFVSYYYVPRSVWEVRDFWRLPKYIDGVLLRSERVLSAVGEAMDYILGGDNVVVVGDPGVGKTVALYVGLIDLFFERGMNVGILLHGSRVGRVHEEEGFVLFLDDAPCHPEILSGIYHNGVHYVFSSARSADWSSINRRLREPFRVVVLESLSRDEIVELIGRYSKYFGIDVDDDALDVIVGRCGGSPIYVRYLFEDARRRGVDRISRGFARSVPEGMYEYVASIIGDLFYEGDRRRDGAYGVALALRILGDFDGFRVNERVFDRIYDFCGGEAKNVFGDPINYDLFLRAKEYLSRDPETSSIGYPHDIWGDIIVGKNTKHRVAKLISLVESKFPMRRRKRIVREAFRLTAGDVEEEYREVGPRVARERFSIAYYARMNRELVGEIFDEEKIREDAENYDLAISRIFVMATPVEEKAPKIVVWVGDKKYVVVGSEVEIGRNPMGANIQIRYGKQIIDTPIMDMSVSRKHMKIVVERKNVYVVDLGSKNGTWIDSKKIEPNRKVPTREVTIGARGLKVKIKVK